MGNKEGFWRTGSATVQARRSWRAARHEDSKHSQPQGGNAGTDEKARVLNPADQALLDLALLEKAIYEVSYEAVHRPDWLHIPLMGLLGMTRKLVPGNRKP